jgi:hypothetical protein
MVPVIWSEATISLTPFAPSAALAARCISPARRSSVSDGEAPCPRQKAACRVFSSFFLPVFFQEVQWFFQVQWWASCLRFSDALPVIILMAMEGIERSAAAQPSERPALLEDGNANSVLSMDPDSLSISAYEPRDDLPDLERYRVVRTLVGHSRAVTAVRFSPDGTRLASASADGTCKLWDVQSGELLHTLQGHDAVGGWDQRTPAVGSPHGLCATRPRRRRRGDATTCRAPRRASPTCAGAATACCWPPPLTT